MPISATDLGIYYAMFGVRDPNQLKHEGELGDYKGKKDELFYLEVTKLINKYIEDSIPDGNIEDIKNLCFDIFGDFITESIPFPTWTNHYGLEDIYTEIRDIAKRIFGNKKIDPDLYKNIATKFSEMLNSLLETTEDGIRLVWEDSLLTHLQTDQVLIPSMLPSVGGFFIWDVDTGEKIEGTAINALPEHYFLAQQAPFIFVHDASGNNGIMRVSLLNNKLPSGFSLGYKNPITGAVIKGAYICNENGNYLMSRVKLAAGEFSVRNYFWYKSNEAISSSINPEYEMLINGEIIKVPMLIYYRTDTKLTGNTFTAFVQKVESVIVPQEAEEQLFKTGISVLSKLKSGIDNKRSDLTISYDYGRDYTFQDACSLISELIDPSFSKPNQFPSLRAILLFPYLNGLHTTSEFTQGTFKLGFDDDQVNLNIRDLGLTRYELNKLSWRNDDGTFMKNQYLKEWLDMIYDAIIAYDETQPNPNEVITKEQDTLANFRDNYDDHDELVTNTKETREKCTPNEWNMAMKIFESACNIFGHGAVRFMLSFMVDFNKDGTIKILSRPSCDMLGVIHDHIGFVPRKYNIDATTKAYKNKALQQFISIFFGDSHVYISRYDVDKKDNSRENSYIFGFGPIILSSPLTITRSGELTGKRVSYTLGLEMASEYERIHGLDSIKEFIDSQDSAYDLFSKLTDRQVIDANHFNSLNAPSLTQIERKALNLWFSTKLKNEYRSTTGLYGFSAGTNHLRDTLEDFIISGDYLYDFEFLSSDTLRNLGLQDNFRLSVSISNLKALGISYKCWGTSPANMQKNLVLVSHSYNKFYNANAKNFYKVAKKIIERFGTDGEKVIIQPAWSTNDPSLGYQHYLTIHNLRKRFYLPIENTVFEVDLNKPEEARYVLEHIAHLIATYDMAFIFKEYVDINLEYKDIIDRKERMNEYFSDFKGVITAVDFTGFLHIEEIYSGYSRNEQIKMGGYITDSRGRTFFDAEVYKDFDRWDDQVWVFKMGLTNNAFLTYYFNKIINSLTDNRAKTMRDILGLNPGGTRR